jgi:hypothetical protein
MISAFQRSAPLDLFLAAQPGSKAVATGRQAEGLLI